MFIKSPVYCEIGNCWLATDVMAAMLGDKNKVFSSKLFYHANSAKMFFIVLTTNMAALSHAWLQAINLYFKKVVWPAGLFHYLQLLVTFSAM